MKARPSSEPCVLSMTAAVAGPKCLTISAVALASVPCATGSFAGMTEVQNAWPIRMHSDVSKVSQQERQVT